MIGIDIVSLFSEQLLPSSYGGVSFWMVDSEDEGGRRVLRFLFPDQDQAEFQDLGQLDGEITVSGLLIGDDYVDQAEQLRDAFRTPGPQTLVHPWLGELQVMQAGEKLPKIEFKHEELRVARFKASFHRYDPAEPPAPDTLLDLLNALDRIRNAANTLLAAAFAVVSLTQSAIGLVESFAGAVGGIWSPLVDAADPQVTTAAAQPLAQLATVDTLKPDASYAGAVATSFSGVSAAIAQTSTPLIPAAVAPGGVTTPPIAVDARATATLVLSAVAQIAALPTPQLTAPALSIAVQAFALADAVTAASDIVFDSQQDATSWHQRLAAALDTTATSAAALASSQPIAAGALWRALIAAKGALAADMTAAIGRLPAVRVFTPPAPMPVWLLAQYLAGDRPGRLLAVYLDLVRRNGIVNPAAPQPGKLEVLT